VGNELPVWDVSRSLKLINNFGGYTEKVAANSEKTVPLCAAALAEKGLVCLRVSFGGSCPGYFGSSLDRVGKLFLDKKINR